MFTITSSRYLRTIQDKNRHQQKPTDTKRHQQTVPGTPKGCSRMRGGSYSHWIAFLVSIGAFWCLTASFSVQCCLELREGCLRSLSKGIWELFMDPFKVWVPPREHLSVQAIFWCSLLCIRKSPKGKIPHTWHFSNIKIPKPPYISSLKIIRFSHFWKSTVSLDHPVLQTSTPASIPNKNANLNKNNNNKQLHH